MKQYRLAVDENGSPFVLNSRGSIDFGYITEEMNLPPAPIRIAEGNEKYGLTHIEMRHGAQIRDQRKYVRITVGTGMPLNSHRRYQKAHHIEVNHERGCLFEHILVPTLPEFQNKLGERRQWTPARCKGPQDRLLITRHVCFCR